MANTWTEKWNEDIDYLKENLINNHANLFFTISREEFEDKVEALKKEVKDLEYDDMKVELSRLVATVKDAHTAIAFPINKFLPIKFYYFNDGIYIININHGYEKLLYKKLIAIEGIPIEEVLEELSKIISHENKYLLKAQIVKYLQAADILYGLYLCEDKDKIKITVEDMDIELQTVDGNELSYVEQQKLPIYAKNSNENYWYEIVKDNELYIKYNSCREDGIKLIKDKINESIDIINRNNITKVTVDLRNNLGGDSTLLQPLLEFISDNNIVNTYENLKVIIGRETFSSALLNAYYFKQNTNAEIIGEPSGGKPNCYGEILRFTLPNSKFNVSYSTRYYKLIDDDSVMALYPDRYVHESVEEFRSILVDTSTNHC